MKLLIIYKSRDLCILAWWEDHLSILDLQNPLGIRRCINLYEDQKGYFNTCQLLEKMDVDSFV